jgi:hypothetical protein
LVGGEEEGEGSATGESGAVRWGGGEEGAAREPAAAWRGSGSGARGRRRDGGGYGRIMGEIDTM